MQEPGVAYTRDDHLRLKMIADLCIGDVLDVGAGTGELRKYYNSDFYTGIDTEPGDGIDEGSIYNLPYRGKSFDTVVLAEVLEHLKDPLLALRICNWIARRQVIISVPNPFNLDQIASVLHNGYNIQNPNHLFLYGDNEIESLCRESGFGKVTKHWFYTRIPGLKWLSPIKSRFGEWVIYQVKV